MGKECADAFGNEVSDRSHPASTSIGPIACSLGPNEPSIQARAAVPVDQRL